MVERAGTAATDELVGGLNTAGAAGGAQTASAPEAREARDHGRVASATQGRVRLRVHRPLRHPHLMRRVHEHLAEQPGVQRVETNAATGSVVVHYDPHQSSHADILAMLADIGVIVRDIAAAGGDELPEAGHSTTSRSIVAALDDLDRRLSRLTGRRIDLKLLFPLTLGAIGLRQTLTEGLGLTQIPGYVLLWYAFDSFWKFHQEPAAAPRADESAPRPAAGRAAGAPPPPEAAPPAPAAGGA